MRDYSGILYRRHAFGGRLECWNNARLALQIGNIDLNLKIHH